MKRTKTILRIIILISIVFYIAGSVTAASFNIAKWDEYSRAVISSLWVFAMVICLLIMELPNEKQP